MTNSLLITSFFLDRFANIVSYFNSFIERFDAFLYSSDKIHILSITFILLILVTIFFFLIFITSKIISLFLKSPSGTEAKAQNQNISDIKEETEIESEQESEIIENDSEEPYEKSPQNIKENFSEQDLQEEEFYRKIPPTKSRTDSFIELDWQKSKKSTEAPERSQIQKEYSPLQLKKNIRDLMAMIVNMIGRNIDELKISQALMYRNKESLSEESVMQLVASIKEFLTLCNKGVFENIRKTKDLPSDEECILHLLSGDASYAMVLMEALMDEKINQAVKTKNVSRRNQLFKEASHYACCFGTLAELSDPNLATSSFELAVETYPDNILAWSRCADLYKQAGLDDRANWAYKQVLKLSKHNENLSQKANANKYLSQYLYTQGDSSQAAELYLESKTYYDSIGINRPLDRKELEIIALLDNTANDSILHSVLHTKQRAL